MTTPLLCDKCRAAIKAHQLALAAERRRNGTEKGGRPATQTRVIRRALRMLRRNNPPSVAAVAKACGIGATTIRRALAKEAKR